MAAQKQSRLDPLTAPLIETFGLSPGVAVAAILGVVLLIGAAIYWFVHSAPPDTITITAGAPGSSFQANAEKYAILLKAQNVTLKILPSQGSLQNLERLNDPKSGVDIGFIQGGVTNDPATNKLISLGSITYAPLLIFYRSTTPFNLISSFSGKRLAIGAEGSGTRTLALQLLSLNGISTKDGTQLAALDGDEAANALLAHKMDVAFLMSDSTSRVVMSNLLHSPDIQLFDFAQADGYARRISFVNKLVLPEGSIDFGKNVPAHDVNLIGTTVEVIAKPKLHPAISDMLIEAMQSVHGGAGVFKRRNEFPAPIEHDFPLSADATRYYKTGKKFPYGTFNFRLANLISRIFVVVIPLIVILVPGLRLIPAALKWRMRMRITRWYRELLYLEKSFRGEKAPIQRDELLNRLAAIETEVNKMKVPASFADQFYNLRGHLLLVRERLR